MNHRGSRRPITLPPRIGIFLRNPPIAHPTDVGLSALACSGGGRKYLLIPTARLDRMSPPMHACGQAQIGPAHRRLPARPPCINVCGAGRCCSPKGRRRWQPVRFVACSMHDHPTQTVLAWLRGPSRARRARVRRGYLGSGRSSKSIVLGTPHSQLIDAPSQHK